MTDLRKAAEMALRALDEAADKIYCEKDDDSIGLARGALRQALAQPEREYMDVVVAEHADGTYTIQRIPLSKREWVGLTDEKEVWEMWVESPSDVLRFAKAIEAKLKEKNT